MRKLSGRLDALTVPRLREELLQERPELLDLSEVSYISSLGLHLLVELGARCQGASPLVREIVAAAGLVDRIRLE